MKFRTKLIVLTSLILLAGMLLTAVIALLGINNLSGLALKEVEKGLVATDQEYFVNFSKANGLRTNLLLGEAVNEIQALGDVTQKLEDNKNDLTTLNNVSLFKDELQPSQAGGWVQSPSTKDAVASVLPYALDSNGNLKPEVQTALQQTALLNLFLPVAQKDGLQKGQVLYFGPPDAPYVRSAPWNDYAGQLSKAFPNDYRTRNLWDYTPSLIQSWEKQATQPGFKYDSPDLITLFSPFDAGGDKGLQMRFLRPIWNQDRTRVRGAVGLDLALNQIVQPVDALKIANTGFAFLVSDDGNIILKDDDQKKLLGFASATQARPDYHLSTVPDIAGLSMPQDEKIIFKEIKINSNRYYTVLTRLSPLNFFSDKTAGIGQKAWTLGFIVPREELLSSWYATEKTINDGATGIVIFTVIASLIGLVIVVGIVYLVSNRMTRPLAALTGGARQIQQKNYDTRVEIKSKDELGQLGQAFNSMAAEIASYTANLEDLVRKRTAQLEQANQEISKLNEQLKSENVRLKAELEITRRLQQMILPKDTELAAINELDIVGFMEPAEEVGGDYYDVLQQNGRVKIGIGDVTGHGLESGVLMIMVQMAIRTLLANQVTEPSDYFNVVNQAIYDNVQRMSSDKNLTLSLLDYKDGLLSLSGQHEDIIIVRADGRLEVINTLDLGFPVGLTDDIASFISQAQVYLNPDDVVVLYTDGITEAENSDKVFYGFDRLCQMVVTNHAKAAREIRNIIIEDVKRYIGEQKVFDDITLLVIKRKAANVVNGELALI